MRIYLFIKSKNNAQQTREIHDDFQNPLSTLISTRIIWCKFIPVRIILFQCNSEDSTLLISSIEDNKYCIFVQLSQH